MFPTTVSQDPGVLYYEANNYFGPADSVPLPASTNVDCHVATAFSPADAQTISPIKDTAHHVFRIHDSGSRVNHRNLSCLSTSARFSHGVKVAPPVETVVSVCAAATPCLNSNHLEDIYEPAPAYTPAFPSFNSDTDLLPPE